jgi:hypothetical protein
MLFGYLQTGTLLLTNLNTIINQKKIEKFFTYQNTFSSVLVTKKKFEKIFIHLNTFFKCFGKIFLSSSSKYINRNIFEKCSGKFNKSQK